MVGHGGSSAGSYLADPTSPIPSHCASIVMTSTLRVNYDSSLSQKKSQNTLIIVRTHECFLAMCSVVTGAIHSWTGAAIPDGHLM